MPHKPTIEIAFTPEFKRNLRGLAKKYPPQERIRLESEAVLAILSRIEKGEWDWVGSDVLTDEIEQTPDTQKLSRAKLLFCILPVLRPQKRTCIYQQMTACSNWQKECQSVCIYE